RQAGRRRSPLRRGGERARPRARRRVRDESLSKGATMNAVLPEKAPKALFIALDSADPDRIRGWAEEGILPTFRSLLGRARWGPVENVPGIYVGAIWTCFYT